MSNYNNLKSSINNNIYENQTQQITGTVLNAILNEMTNALGAGYQFAGVATVGMTPSEPDARIFYLAGEGIYTSFDGIQVPAGKLGILKWDSRWHLETIDGLGSGGANLTGYVTVASTDDLPDEGVATLGYLCGENLYLYVGEGGDTKEGKYQNCGSFRGPQGDSVQDVEQTQTSLENGGVNKIKFTLSNGISCEFQVRNGTTSSGLFPTLAALQAAYPSPVVGQYAFVGSGFPADIYVCTTAGTWTDSGEDYDGDNVDLTDYATKAEVNELDLKVDEKIDGVEQNAVAGKYINSSGTLVNDPNTTVIGFLPYTSGDVVWKYGTRNANYAICFYDSDKQLITSWSTISNNAIKERTITASEIATSAPGAAFLKASIKIADGEGVEIGGVLIHPVYQTVVGIEPRVSDLEGDVQDLQDADTALSGRIDGNDDDIADLKAKDVQIEGRLENIEGPYISPDNGVGGVTSSTKITQGGALVSAPFDFSRPFVYEAVLKPQNGSTVAILNLAERYGNTSRSVSFRIHNGNFQLCLFSGSTSTYPINQSFQNVLGLVFGQWYHLCVVYDGTAVYLFANGVQRYKNEIVITQSDANSTNGCESDSLHSPKLLRLCHITIPEGKTAQDIALAHYNGGNPFGYDSSNDELYIEILPENMLKTSIKNTANDVTVTYGTEKTFDILTENPWAAVIEGVGVPATVPVYKWQKYKDTSTGKVYTAKGNETVNDWVYQATSEDLIALRTQTKTVGGQSIWGAGDIPAGSGSGAGTFVSVADFGATGDGVTDDTTALQSALEYARANNRALYFPNGTFLTRKGFVLTSGMRVTGEPDAIIQNAAATIEGGGKCPYTTTTANAAQGDHSVVVTDASKFRVGDEIVIWKSGSYTETMADITAINGNTITFDTSRFTADGTDGGLLNAVASAGYVLTDFAMFKTIMTKAAVNVVVENITIKPLSDMNEPHIYTSSPISQTKQGGAEPQSNFRVYNVTCYDSANDGISLQGTGDSEVIGCRVFNQKHKGIHFGTSHDKIVISKNYCYGCGSAQYENYGDYQGSGAIFFCSNNHRVIITDNIFENCYKGVYGFNYQGNGEQDTDTIIANNTFKNCGLYGLMLRGGYRAVVVGNIFTDFNNSAIPIHTEAESTFKFTAGVISNNVFGNFGSAFAGPAIEVTGARNLVLAGNNVSGYVNNDASTVRDHCDITVATSEKVAITNNVVDGVIDISDAGNTGIVKDNNIETS